MSDAADITRVQQMTRLPRHAAATLMAVYSSAQLRHCHAFTPRYYKAHI